MASHRFLAFDFGAESGRSIIGTLADEHLSLAETHRFENPSGVLNGVLQWNLLEQWEAVQRGIAKSLESLSPAERAFDGIGVDTWGVDFALLGADGQFLGNPAHYRDERTRGLFDHAFARVAKRDIFEATGIQFLEFNTLYQLLAMTRAKSSHLGAASTLLFMSDVFNYLLTGIARTEASQASTSQLFDPRTRSWDASLTQRLGLPVKILPPIVAPGTVLGPVKQDLLLAGTPVIATTGHDTASAVVAVPAEGESWAYLSSGTWSLLGVELPQPAITDRSFELNYTNEAGFGGTTRLLKNIMGLWLVQGCRKAFELAGRSYDYATLTCLAADAPSFRTLIDVNEDLFLRGNTLATIESFCQRAHQPVPETDGQFVRACLDSLALDYRRKLDGLESILGRRIEVLHIVGGGSQNELLNQLTADAIARPVIAGPVEATAIGNLLVQAMAVGAVGSLAEARQIVRSSFDVKRYEPQRDVNDAYERYQRLVSDRVAT